MTAKLGPTIAILGLGNLMRTDDALGMLILDEIAKDDRFPADVRIIAGGTLGLDLLHDLRDVTHLITIDTVDVGATPGTLSRFDGDAMAELPTSKSVHLLGFSDLINVMRLMGSAPQQMLLLGVQPDYTGWGTSLTLPVAAAQPHLIEAALQQIRTWTADSGANATLLLETTA
jgi:hydrogenase maturation protease